MRFSPGFHPLPTRAYDAIMNSVFVGRWAKMVLILCVDDKGGMAFNGRRQSMDRLLRADLLMAAGERALWVSPYTARQFDPVPANLRPAEDFLLRAGPGEFCFAEFPPLTQVLDRVEGILLYRWNRTYPADQYLDFDPAAAGFRLISAVDFPGSSHKTLTKEVYTR